MKALSVFIALTASNYVYQLGSTDPSWTDAFQRTWFQGTALLCYFLVDKFIWRD